MALFRAGSLVLKSFKPEINLCFAIPNSLNMQVRHAARKGYRDKARRLKKLSKIEQAMSTETKKMRKGYSKIEKTVEIKVQDAPNDDIILWNEFKHIKYSLSDAVKLHRECHHPSVSNNPEAPVIVRIEISMIGKKITQILKPFAGIAKIPHPILSQHRKEVLVLCDPEFKDIALKSGASVAGGEEIIKKIQSGVIQPSVYDFIICHINFLPQIAPIRGLLKDQVPKLKQGTLTADLPESIQKFLYGIQYVSVKINSKKDNFGIVECVIGSIDMDLDKLEENFQALMDDVLKHQPNKDREFVTWIWCMSPPSDEKFAINLSKYLPDKNEKVEYDDDDDDEGEEKSEKIEIEKLKKSLENEAALQSTA